jgi:hypothetical protein
MPLRAPAARRLAPFALDILVTAIVISAMLAALLPEVGTALFKARFVEVLSALSHERPAMIEWHAHAGTWSVAAQQDKPQRAYQVVTAGGSIVAAGALSGRRFAAGMRPAVAHAVGDWSVIWLCGTRRPPSGWAAAAASAPFDLPDGLRLSVCRQEAP